MEAQLFGISALALILVGVFGVLTRKNIIKALLALGILETGINLALVSTGYFEGARAPIITRGIEGKDFLSFVDPLPQVLALISIFIGLGWAALALAVALKYFRAKKSLELGGNEGGE